MKALARSLSATNIAYAERLRVHPPWIIVLALAAMGPLTAVASAGLMITTTAGPTVSLGTGQPLTDTITVAGGLTEQNGIPGFGGQLEILLAGSQVGVVSDTFTPILNNGTFNTSFLPTVAGQYEWVVSYSGDAVNPFFRADPEMETVCPGFCVTTTPGPTVSLGSGQPLTDTITVAGGLTQKNGIPGFGGELEILLAGSQVGVVSDTFTPIINNGTFSTSFLPTVAGQYQWVVSYSGDAVNPIFDAGVEMENVTGAATVPEPSTWQLASVGAILAGLIALARKRQMIA